MWSLLVRALRVQVRAEEGKSVQGSDWGEVRCQRVGSGELQTCRPESAQTLCNVCTHMCVSVCKGAQGCEKVQALDEPADAFFPSKPDLTKQWQCHKHLDALTQHCGRAASCQLSRNT